MPNGLIPSTFAVALAAVAVACGGASDKDVREAQTSGYKGDFAVIYSEALAAVRDLYPQINEDARTGIIRTAWHPVHVQQGPDDDSANRATVNPATPRTGFNTTTTLREQFFVRFDIHVVGGRPWRVRVNGQASSWKAGDGMPTPLRGPETPHWLEGRVNGLEVAIHQRLKGYAVELKYAPAPAAKAPARADVAKYGQLPPGAARVIAAVEQAAGARDVAALRRFMADQFTYNSGDQASADTAIVVWQADPSLLAELSKALDAGCAHDRARREVVCPAAFLQDAGQTGYRAGFREAGGAWQMVYFTPGD